jgi:hypothetical protein
MATKNGYGLLARYETPADIFHACERVRDAGYSKWDSFTPFPVHGLERAMGLKPSILPWLVLGAGLFGGIFAISFMVWVSAYDYPLNIGGKPTWSVPAFIPVTFEFTVLLSCLTAFFGLWFLCRLPQLFHPVFQSKAFEKATDDKFFIMIEASDAKFDAAKTKKLLEETGASHIEELED